MFDKYNDLLDISDLQEVLDVGRSMAYRLISSGEINHFKVGKKIRIPKRELVDYIERSCYNNDSSRSAVNEKGVD